MQTRQQLNQALRSIQAAAGSMLSPSSANDGTILRQLATHEALFQDIEAAIAAFRAAVHQSAK